MSETQSESDQFVGIFHRVHHNFTRNPVPSYTQVDIAVKIDICGVLADTRFEENTVFSLVKRELQFPVNGDATFNRTSRTLDLLIK